MREDIVGSLQKISVVGGQNLEQTLKETVTHALGFIRSLGLSQKVATKLWRDAWETIEQGQPFREPARAYVGARFEEQIACYIALGLHEAAGFTEKSFRSALNPLRDRVLRSFEPPAEHPIIDGEFTLLLVLPEEWVSLRRILAEVTGRRFVVYEEEVIEKEISLVSANRRESTESGKALPSTPYALVGIDGGRGLKGLTLEQANAEVKKKNLTYFSLRDMAHLFLVRPGFFPERCETIAFGDRSGETYNGFLRYSPADVHCIRASFLQPMPQYGRGVSKPYYTKMIVA